jgi:hypothetical protein
MGDLSNKPKQTAQMFALNLTGITQWMCIGQSSTHSLSSAATFFHVRAPPFCHSVHTLHSSRLKTGDICSR